MSVAPQTKLTAAQLIAAGYRCTSRNHGHASRIDRPDWQQVIARHMDRTLDEVRQARRGELEDYYRSGPQWRHRDASPPKDVRSFPTSSFDPAGYVEPAPVTDESPAP